MRYFWLPLLSIFIFSCTSNSSVDEIQTTTKEEDRTALYAEGKRLMENKCYVCHNPNVKEKHLIAPPLVDVKKAYYVNDEEEFVHSFIAFLNSPDQAKAKLPDAVEKYGLMPYQRYDTESLRKIALYMYNNQIQEPEWWEGTQQGAKKLSSDETEEKSYEDIGLSYALSTKQVLGSNLMGTIQREGVLEAVEFCNVVAYPLTDSMSQVHQAKIKRVSDQPRNPKNLANSTDLKYIELYKQAVLNEKEIKPSIIEDEHQVTFYHPIITNDKCLLCHGKKETIEEDVFKALKERYPEDKATGYNANEVRGVWKIVFEK